MKESPGAKLNEWLGGMDTFIQVIIIMILLTKPKMIYLK